MTDIFTGRVKPDSTHRPTEVGMTAASVNDTFMTSAVKGTLLTAALGNQGVPDQHKLIYGVEIEAHATSQIANAVLNGRPLLHIWSEGCLDSGLGSSGGLPWD